MRFGDKVRHLLKRSHQVNRVIAVIRKVNTETANRVDDRYFERLADTYIATVISN